MTSIFATDFLRKLKNKVDWDSKIQSETFPNDEEIYIESTGLPSGAISLVTCEGEPSTFRMNNETNKVNRRESKDSLLKFAIQFSKDNDSNSSSSGEPDTTSSRHHSDESIIHGQDIPMSEYSDGRTGREYDDRENNEQTNKSTDRLRSDDEIVTDPGTYLLDGEGQTDNGNEINGDDKSCPSEKSQSFPSSPLVPSGVDCNDQGLRRRRINRRRDHVVIEIEEENESKNEHFQTPSGHVESYLYIMQFLGVSSFRRIEYQNLNVALSFLLRALFWVVSACAFLESLMELKRAAIIQDAETDKDLKYCVEVGFEMIRCFGRVFLIRLVGTQIEKLAVMLLYIRNLRLTANKGEFSFSMLSLLLAISTILFTTINVFFGYLFLDEWTWNDALKWGAYALAESLFVWTSSENVTDSLADKYLIKDLTLEHAAMRLLEGFIDFCGTLQGEAIRDLLILAGLTILVDQKIFEQRIRPQILVHPNNADPAEVEGSLRHFKSLQEESSSINETLVAPFKFIVIQNLLLYAHLVIQLIVYKGLTMELIHSTVNGLKGLILFYIGILLHWKNPNIKKWLNLMSSYSGQVDVEEILGMNLQTCIADFKENPIGIGSDYFLINEAFLVGVFASVGSLISLLFQFDKQEAILRRLFL